jgi:hypothetical protein
MTPDMLKNGIDYANMERYIDQLGLQADIRLIEVIIDLDATQNVLSDASSTILDDLFGEQ